MKVYSVFLVFITLILFGCQSGTERADVSSQIRTSDFASNDYQDLEELFKEWRSFERPPYVDGAPDYTAATFDQRWPAFKKLQSSLQSIDTSGWPVEHQVDWMIVWAEMNGYDFNHRILKPWARDPAFYKSVWTYRSDVPAHEGPTHHGTTELWTYDFPLSAEARERFVYDLKTIAPLNTQAQRNLIGNAKDLWIAGIRDIKRQSSVLAGMKDLEGVAEDQELVMIIDQAISSTDDFALWLEEASTSKTGPSGIGKENYTWYLQNVHLVPLTWEDEVMILKRELARAWSALKLEEHRNRKLPQLEEIDTPAAYDRMADASAKSLINFLDQQDIVTVKPYFDPALREHLGAFVPKEKRNFFWIGVHFDPRPMYSHFYHWFCLLYTSPSPRDKRQSRMPSSA